MEFVVLGGGFDLSCTVGGEGSVVYARLRRDKEGIHAAVMEDASFAAGLSFPAVRRDDWAALHRRLFFNWEANGRRNELRR